MIDYERLNQFIHEELKYKDNIEVSYCRIVGDKFIDVKFSRKGKKHAFEAGELIDMKRYKDWLKKFERDEAIGKIID